MSVSKDFLLSVYEQCNEHLKERSARRDQAIALYLVVISFYFGSYSAINELLVSPYPPVLFNMVIYLTGGMTIRTLSGLRSWHTQYANSALMLNRVISKNIFELDILNSGIRSFFDKKEKEYHEMSFVKMSSSIENRVILGMTLIFGSPVVVLVKEVMSLLKVSNKKIIVLVECAFYLACVVYYFYNTIMIIRESTNHRVWIVSLERDYC